MKKLDKKGLASLVIDGVVRLTESMDVRAYIMEPDNLGWIIPPQKKDPLYSTYTRGDWLGSKLGGRINHPHKLIGLSVFCMVDCGRTVGS